VCIKIPLNSYYSVQVGRKTEKSRVEFPTVMGTRGHKGTR